MPLPRINESDPRWMPINALVNRMVALDEHNDPWAAYQVAKVLVTALFLQAISRWLQGHVAWQVLPATAIWEWYYLSLQDTALSWIWPSAFLVLRLTRGDVVRACLLLVTLSVVARGLPEASLWEASVYTREELWLIGLSSWSEALVKDAVMSAMALVVARRPTLAGLIVPLAALRIFI
ncbi:hypothetical protein BH09SUM1_BH09SUM1_00950 [soil metagenome]